jgi:hypothetical protein
MCVCVGGDGGRMQTPSQIQNKRSFLNSGNRGEFAEMIF